MRNLSFKILAFTFAMGIAEPNAHAQSREDFDAYMARERREFANYRAERRAEFNRYREQYNREFAKHLKEAWKRVKPEEKIAPPHQPKPFVPKPPEEDAQPQPKPKEQKEMPVASVIRSVVTPPAPKPIVIDEPKEEETQSRIHVDAFGQDFALRCSDKVKISLADNNPNTIAAAWEALSSKELDPLVYDCQQAREKHSMCDWMYYLFLQDVAHKVVQTKTATNESTLLTGYLLAQSGLDFRFARHGKCLSLALPFDTQVYECNYFNIDGKKFYIVDKAFNNTSCNLMDRSFSKEAAPMALRMTALPKMKNKIWERRTLTSKKYPELSVDVSTNTHLLSLYLTYPRMDWQEYSMTPMADNAKESIIKVFGPVLAGKSEEEAVNMILNFVQTAFAYGYDDEHWGGDHPFFADETLYYPQSDCEDRAILFSQLVRMLTKQDVVLLHYPNHLSTAVRFSQDLPGDYVMVNGEKYLVCDPTGYKPVGGAYDEFQNEKAKVIKLK